MSEWSGPGDSPPQDTRSHVFLLERTRQKLIAAVRSPKTSAQVAVKFQQARWKVGCFRPVDVFVSLFFCNNNNSGCNCRYLNSFYQTTTACKVFYLFSFKRSLLKYFFSFVCTEQHENITTIIIVIIIIIMITSLNTCVSVLDCLSSVFFADVCNLKSIRTTLYKVTIWML